MSELAPLYTTLEQVGEADFEEKKSVFIGYAGHVTTEDEAMSFIKERRDSFRDATHNVWAYLLDGGIHCRYSDDGEPQGTAGMPVLDGIRKAGVTDAAVVVTRYFGGTLLGAGGLVRAYSHACKIALDAAHIVTYSVYKELELVCSYSDYQKYLAEFPKYGVLVDESRFEESVTLRLALKAGAAEGFLTRVNELSGGRASVTQVGERYDYR